MNKSTGILFRVISLSVVTAFLLTTMLWVGCQRTAPTSAPQADETQQGIELSKDNPAIQAVMNIQDKHTPELMAYPDVIGTATGLTADGRPAIIVYSTKQIDEKATLQKGKSLPTEIDGIPVVVEYTEPIRPMAAHTGKQSLPIQLGTSGGWTYDLANGYCCGGTLGSLVQISGQKYVMSNYHVLEADIVSGGNSRVASNGDPVIQPGLIDVNCTAANAQNVATLALKHSLPNSNVDVAVAQIISGAVNTNGSILEIGTISAQTIAASVNQKVKKSGRTTGLTRSTVSALNATISIEYENECAGGVAFTKTFTGQIVVKNARSKFLAGGDSGSLLVQDVTSNPRSIGLLFAGSTTLAIANPISQVLSFLGATMVGN
jgi:hypothetical protein